MGNSESDTRWTPYPGNTEEVVVQVAAYYERTKAAMVRAPAPLVEAPPRRLTIKERLHELEDELHDIIKSADDIGWRSVQHPLETAMGYVTSAIEAAGQYESGLLEPRE